MTEDEKDQACYESLFDGALEARIAAEEWWQTPEGQAQVAKEEAEIEALFEEGGRLDAEIEAYLSKHRRTT